MSGALRTFLLLGPNAALGADEHQWILYRAGQPVSYIRSTKAVLVRCIREKGIELSSEGKAALSTHWRMISTPGRPIQRGGALR